MYSPTFSPIDKIVELYEKLIVEKDEQIMLLKGLLERKQLLCCGKWDVSSNRVSGGVCHTQNKNRTLDYQLVTARLEESAENKKIICTVSRYTI